MTKLFLKSKCRFLEPLITGDYPNSMRSRVGNRLPKFSQAQSLAVKGSFDFIGINHYTTWYAKHNDTNIFGVLLNDTFADMGATTLRMFYSPHLSFFKFAKNSLCFLAYFKVVYGVSKDDVLTIYLF